MPPLRYCLFMLIAIPGIVSANSPLNLHATSHPIGFLCLFLFILAYGLVMAEEFVRMRKSKPVLMAAGIIWALVGYLGTTMGAEEAVNAAVRVDLLEYAELLLFLLVAMTYIHVMQERNVFEALRAWLVSCRLSYKQLFWISGFLAFFISPIADNLTTALILCAIIMTVGSDKPSFVSASCINIVVAANAGGAFSPFGDITTLMVWQKGVLAFWDFFALFIPSLVNFLVPAALIQFSIPKGLPNAVEENVRLLTGAKAIVGLFLLTIITAVAFHHFLHLPPTIGMMTGLGYLKLYSFYLNMRYHKQVAILPLSASLDVFKKIQSLEWDTLLFFYGVVLCVGGLATIGYLEFISLSLFEDPSMHTFANVVIGLLSAVIDNIPVMFAVLTMSPEMSEGQWLLVTLTTAVGGSLLSIGSAAGVALMGQTRGLYTFMSHLRWSWAIGLGYVVSIYAHYLLNQHLF